MTIYTPSAADKKPEKTTDEPEVVTEPLTGTKFVEEVPINAINELQVQYLRQKRRRMVIFLILISAVLVIFLNVGIILTYKHFNKKNDQQVYRGVCGTQFYDELYHGVDISEADSEEIEEEDDYVNEDMLVDTFNNYEQFHTPMFDEVRESYVVHDFSMNYTALIDHEWKRCYITGIRKNILRPSDLVIQIKDASGSTMVMKTIVIREDYLMVLPSGLNSSPLGRKISEMCSQYQIYWLELFVNGVTKRSINAPVATYAQLTNNKAQPIMFKMRIHERQHSDK